MNLTVLQVLFVFLTFTYLFGAIISLFLGSRHKTINYVSNSIAILAASQGIIFSLLKLILFKDSVLSMNIDTNIPNISINIYIDNLSAFFILLISVLTLLISIYSYGYNTHYIGYRNVGLLGFLYNLLIVSMVMVVTSGHMFFFLVVWEIMSLTSYFLVIFESESNENQRAGIIYVIMTHVGTAFIIAAFVLLYKYSGTAVISQIDGSKIPDSLKSIIFIFTLIGFGTKAGIIPLHVWLPVAYPAAPSNISAIMSGAMSKTAVYGIVRIILGVLGGQFLWWGTVILILGAISTFIGIAYALMEANIKRLLAYSSIENMGIIFIGLGISIISQSYGKPGIAVFALTAALLHVFNHSIFKGLLFMGAGSIHYATGTKDMEKLGGLIKKMPFTSVFFLIGSMAISALPPLNGFVSEWLTYQSLFVNIIESNSAIKLVLILTAAILAIAGAMAAFSFIKAFGISFLAMPRTNHATNAREVPKTMLSAMGILSAICLLAGILPIFVIRIIDNINVQLFKTSVLSDVCGFSTFVAYPIEVRNNAISPISILMLSILFASLIYYFVQILRSKTSKRYYGTWDCGYVNLTPKMQYSATGFSKPLRIIFRGMFKPHRELKVEESSSPYFLRSAKYIVTTQTFIERYLYKPVIRRTINFSRRTRLIIQTGSIHTYLIYILAVIILMFVYFVKT